MDNNTKAPVPVPVQPQEKMQAPTPTPVQKQSWLDWVKSKMPSFDAKKTGGKYSRKNRKNGGYRYTSKSKSQTKSSARPKKTRKTSSRKTSSR